MLSKGDRIGSLAAGVTLSLVLGLVLHVSPWGRWLDAKYFDLETRLLRGSSSASVPRDVVVVGIDETTIASLPEPITLWHHHLGDFLRATASGGAMAVGVDIALPERSFNQIVPGYDEALLGGMLSAKRSAPLVLAITVDGQGVVRPLSRKFEVVAGEAGLGFALFPRDRDQRVRRFDEQLATDGKTVPTLVGQLARALDLPAGPTFIDASFGPSFSYVPLHKVLASYRAGDEEALRHMFAGKIVLLGTVLPVEDRLPLPVNLAGWEENGNLVPGVLLHAQVMRMKLNGRAVQLAPVAWVASLIVLGALLWIVPFGALGKIAIALAWTVGLLAGGLAMFRSGTYLPLSAATATGILALVGRGSVDALMRLRERRLLRGAFGSSVSPHVLDEILSGAIQPSLGGTRKFACILFSDIRGFTPRSEAMTPEEGIELLNRYFEYVVQQIHDHNGAVINFMGDGIMAIFGEPKRLDNACEAGFSAAKAMQAALADFNETLIEEGIQPVQIGVGVHAGDVVIGNTGSSTRNNYTAIGDAANVASRVESLTKLVGYSVVCSKAVVDNLNDRGGLVELGPQKIKGHTPVEVFGWGKL